MKQPLLFFLPDVMGGVGSVVLNVVLHAGENEKRSSVIAYNDRRDERKPIVFSGDKKAWFQRFYYDRHSNLYYTVRKLRKFIAVPNPAIIATDGMELEMMRLTRTDEKIVFIVLGDFEHYYGLARKYASIIDGFIAISNEIYTKLLAIFPRRTADIHLAYFPTPAVSGVKTLPIKKSLRILFAGRLEAGKNPLALLGINKILRDKEIEIKWTIVGDGPLGKSFTELTADKPEFSFAGTLSNHSLQQLYLEQDIFIMTSEMEGMPVSLIEAMKAGLVPVVSNIPGGIKEVVTNGINGFLCAYNDEAAFADSIAQMSGNPTLYGRLSAAAIETASRQFDPEKNSKRYFDIVESTSFKKGTKQFTAGTENKLDRFWIPGFIVKWIRDFQYIIKQQ